MDLTDEIKRLYDKYGSISQVSRELKISRNTIRKYLARLNNVRDGIQSEIVTDKKRRTNRILTPQLVEFVNRKLEENKTKPRKQKLSALDIHRLAQASGYQVGYSSIKNLVHEWKQTNTSREIFIIQDPPEGYRAEFDWGFVDLCINGSYKKIPLSVFTLNFSQYRFGKLYPSQTTFDVIQAHVDFFNAIVAVPQTLFYDNATTIYDRKTDRYNSTFLSCARHYGFEPKVCNCASPHEKGSTEKSVSVIRRSAFSENIHYSTLKDANTHLFKCLDGLNQQKVHQRVKVPEKLLEDERPFLLHLPVMQFSNYELHHATINGYGLIQFQKNYYSVPEKFCSKTILLKVYSDKIEMLENGSVIAVHNRFFESGNYSLQISHYLEVLNRKPGSIRHSRLLRLQDQIIQNAFEEYYSTNPKEFVPVLGLIKEFSSERICEAIKACNIREIPPTPEILKIFIKGIKLDQKVLDSILKMPFNIPNPDLKTFDNLLEKGENK